MAGLVSLWSAAMLVAGGAAMQTAGHPHGDVDSSCLLQLAVEGATRNASGAAEGFGDTTGASISTTVRPVAVVMFDHNYMKLFDCFLRYWARQVVDWEHTNKLDVVVYDKVAYNHAQGVIRTYPAGIVRNLQLHEVHPRGQRRMQRRAAFGGRSAWSSYAYMTYFWQAILEHLEMGEDVLHIDLDAIVVGDAWAPLESSDPAADVVAKWCDYGLLGQEYILYRSTPAMKEVVRHFASAWEEWLSGAMITKPPFPAEQKALGEYVSENGGCSQEKNNTLRMCKTHTGGTFAWDAVASLERGVAQHGHCEFPEECRARATHVSHGRPRLGVYCSAEEIHGPQHHG